MRSRFPKTRLGLCGAVVLCSLKLMLYITLLGVCVPACENGGTCVNSKCQCSQGLYEGNYCQTGKKVEGQFANFCYITCLTSDRFF